MDSSSSAPDKISQSLGIAPLQKEEILISDSLTNPIDGDYNYARTNMVNTIEKGNEALQGILDVASMGQHPRAYEVAANLVKTMIEANKELFDLQKKKKEIERIEAKINPQTINNNLFVGSTAELLKAFKSNNIKDIE